MIEAAISLINQAVFAGLILFGIYVVLQNMRAFLLPQKVGTIVSLGGLSEKGIICGECNFMPGEAGKSTIPLDVRLDSGEFCRAETSPCCICIDRMKVGDRVGITKSGSRIIAQKVSGLHAGGA